MIFVINSLKYDTTKMELISTKCEYKYTGTMLNMTLRYSGKNVKIFHKKPDPCDGCDMAMLTSWISCDTCVDGCNKRKATEKELDDFMKYRGSLMGKE